MSLKISDKNRKWWILASCATALSMVFVDQTALPVALPAMRQELHISSATVQWVINAYLLMLATFVIFGGKVSDNYGHRRLFILGQILFVLSSITCALAQTGLSVIISRGVQGIGGALMIPPTTAIIYSSFQPHERGRAMGVYIGFSSIFLTLGPLLGGLLTQHLGWRWVFWINFPMVILGILLSLHSIPKDKIPVNKSRIDFIGFFWMALALFFLVFGLMESVQFGWLSLPILSSFGISFISAVCFFITEKSRQNPLIDLHIFKDKYFTNSIIIMLSAQATFIVVIFWILFLQYVIPVSASTAGAIVITAQAPITFMAPLAGRFIDRYGARVAATTGIIFTILSLIWVAILAWKQNYFWLLPGFFVFGSAAPLVMFGILSNALKNIEPEKRGTASGIINSARQLGSSIGLAILTSIMTGINYAYIQDTLRRTQTHLGVEDIERLLSTPKGLSQLTATDAAWTHQLAIHSYIFSFSCIVLIAACFSVIGLFFVRHLPGKINAPPQSV